MTLKKIVPNLKASKNKRRFAMPQISDHDAFIKDLEKNNISVFTDSIDPQELTPTQKEFNWEKVESLLKTNWKEKPIITSDDFVGDGHHRWLCAVEEKVNIKCRVVGLGIDDLIKFLKDKPYTRTKTINESSSMSMMPTVQEYYSIIAEGK